MPDFDRVTAIFAAAIELDAAHRGAFLDAECAGDAELRAEIESLLAASLRADGFMEVPAAVACGLAVADPAPLLPGARLGPYVIQGQLGRGGMGIVYLAEDTRLARKVAIKALAPEHTRNERRRERLRVEARAAAALSHPGIATVLALEEIDAQLFLVCEYVRGATLREEVERGAVPVPVLLDTGIQLARALAAAHAAGIVHRDLKPENVIRAESGVVKILDFGVARFDPISPLPLRRLTDAGVILGTPAYMSPEQLEGLPTDGRSDIFALGVLLFELVSRKHPFETATPASTAARVIAADPPSLCEIDPRIPEALEAALRRCLQKDPAERYQSASELAADLEALRGPGASQSLASASAAKSRGQAAITPAGWWVVHQLAVMAAAALMVWPVWLVHDTTNTHWTVGLLLAAIAAAAANGTMRAHLLFTYWVNRGEIREQMARTSAWLRRLDWAFAAVLLAASVPTARSRTALSAVLAAVSIGWVVTAVVIEPATRRAAFPEGRRPSRP